MTNVFSCSEERAEVSVTNLQLISPGQKICHRKSTTFFTLKVSKVHHLELLGPLWCKSGPKLALESPH